jgi:hypothetical protein
MKTFYKLLGVVLSVSMMTLITGCGGGGGTTATTSTVSMSVTDAPIDDENVDGVYVTFTALRYQYNDSNDSWQDVDLNGSRTINLLALQDGNYTVLDTTELPAGEIRHVRFVLDLDNCYITFKDDTQTQLKLDIPSGGQTGYKSVNGFVIATGGVTNITADFDVRKSVTVTGKGVYKLKPTIRLVDNIEIGEIDGTLNVDANNSAMIVYAYQDGTWDDNQTDPANDFNNAVTSANATDGNFTFAWLTAGTYDLVVAGYDNTGAFENIIGFVPDVTVSPNSTTTVDITSDTLQDTM